MTRKEWVIFPFVAVSLSVIGLFVIYALKPELFEAQLIAVLVGIGIMIGLAMVPFPWLVATAPFVGGVSLVFLVMTLMSPAVRGAQRWVFLGPIHFQPSEFVKLALVLMTWWLVIKYPIEKLYQLKNLLVIGLGVGLVLFIIGLQPDLGTAGFIGMVVGLASLPLWVNWKRLMVIGVLGLILVPFGWYQLKPYQKQRVVAFLDPLSDPKGSGYNIIRALLAIENGGWWGAVGKEGLYQYSLPEAHTDFIFAVWVEDTGVAGGVIMLVLYGLFLVGMLGARRKVTKLEEGVLLLITGFIVIQALFHVGINLGVLPVTGLPLPFVSYGRSSILVSFGLVGVLISRLRAEYWLDRDRFKIKRFWGLRLKPKGGKLMHRFN